jgi:hypothetical protein
VSFFAVSTLALSVFTLELSVANLAESADLAESAAFKESAEAEDDLLLQAAKEQAIARAKTLTLIEFFMLFCFKSI